MNLTTTSPNETRPVLNRYWWSCLRTLFLLLLLYSAGCATRGGFGLNNFHSRPPVFTFHSTKSEVFAHLNRTSQHVHGWRSLNCNVRPRQIPMKFNAIVACESSMKFRTIVSSIRGREMDFGSNDQYFWFWANEGSDKPLLYSLHQNLPTAQTHLPIPFNPEWLMEVMGVVPFDESEFQMEYKPQDSTINLVNATSDSQGRTVYRRIIVDAQSGNIKKHEMYGAQQELIATATMGNYKAVGPNQVNMPHQIYLEWPQTEMAFDLRFPAIQINPDSSDNDGQWEIPRITKNVIDIGSIRALPASFQQR
ncbi:MAG: hypothetical protein KDA65_10460 [Planctomycetaceae bacterium]|nr:hypothetical protein [Planctomycetaceae bacterium]